jgi:UDP-GlcNAc:undecaprenyl-phosphate GlcNAc-1-phosphate transferase
MVALSGVLSAAGLLSFAIAALLVRSAGLRTTGAAVAAAWALVLGFVRIAGPQQLQRALGDLPLVEVIVASIIVLSAGLWEDARKLSPRAKILAQLIAATLVIGAGVQIPNVTINGTTWSLGSFAVTATVLWMFALIGAFEQLRQLDALGTWLTLAAGILSATIVIVRHDMATATLLVAMVGALMGAAVFASRGTRLTLGRAGLDFAGFILAIGAITGIQKSATLLAAGAAIVIFAAPIAEGVYRFLKWRAHRQRQQRMAGARTPTA